MQTCFTLFLSHIAEKLQSRSCLFYVCEIAVVAVGAWFLKALNSLFVAINRIRTCRLVYLLLVCTEKAYGRKRL
jgi:hypothetical protein